MIRGLQIHFPLFPRFFAKFDPCSCKCSDFAIKGSVLDGNLYEKFSFNSNDRKTVTTQVDEFDNSYSCWTLLDNKYTCFDVFLSQMSCSAAVNVMFPCFAFVALNYSSFAVVDVNYPFFATFFMTTWHCRIQGSILSIEDGSNTYNLQRRKNILVKRR